MGCKFAENGNCAFFNAKFGKVVSTDRKGVQEIVIPVDVVMEAIANQGLRATIMSMPELQQGETQWMYAQYLRCMKQYFSCNKSAQ